MEIIRDYKLFKSKTDHTKKQDKFCNYEGLSAACGQLMITLPGPLSESDAEKIIEILKRFDAKIVGQIPDLDTIQIEVESERIIKLKADLEDTGLIEVDYIIETELD